MARARISLLGALLLCSNAKAESESARVNLSVQFEAHPSSDRVVVLSKIRAALSLGSELDLTSEYCGSNETVLRVIPVRESKFGLLVKFERSADGDVYQKIGYRHIGEVPVPIEVECGEEVLTIRLQRVADGQ